MNFIETYVMGQIPTFLKKKIFIFNVQNSESPPFAFFFFGPKASGSHPFSSRAKAATVPGPRRNPTIKISRATRVQEQWNASLDREINDTNELHHLDEFLGNQVHVNPLILSSDVHP